MSKEMAEKLIWVVNPPYYRFFGYGLRYMPLGPAYIFSALKGKGFKVKFLNFDYQRDIVDEQLSFTAQEQVFRRNIHDPGYAAYAEFKKSLLIESPAVVLIHFHSSNLFSVIKQMVKIIKEVCPQVKVVVGGIHPTVFPENTLRETGVDIVVCGEGEETIAELIPNLEFTKNLPKVAGIAYLENGKFYLTPQRSLINNLDSLAYPSLYLQRDRQGYNSGYYGTMMISRGCSANCYFCSTQAMWRNTIRFRSAESAVEEMIFVQKKFRTREFTFLDDVFTLNRELVERLCYLIRKKRLNVIWTCLTRADLVDKNIIKAMKSAGCFYILLGVESGAQGILDAMGKNSNLRLMKEKINLIQKEGILVRTFFMLGYPGETPLSLALTQKTLGVLKPDSGIVFFTVPLPGSELYRHSDLRHLGWDDYNINFPGAIQLEGLTKEDLLDAQKNMFRFIYQQHFKAAGKLLLNTRYLYNRFFECLLDPARMLAYFKMFKELILSKLKSRHE